MADHRLNAYELGLVAGARRQLELATLAHSPVCECELCSARSLCNLDDPEFLIVPNVTFAQPTPPPETKPSDGPSFDEFSWACYDCDWTGNYEDLLKHRHVSGHRAKAVPPETWTPEEILRREG